MSKVFLCGLCEKFIKKFFPKKKKKFFPDSKVYWGEGKHLDGESFCMWNGGSSPKGICSRDQPGSLLQPLELSLESGEQKDALCKSCCVSAQGNQNCTCILVNKLVVRKEVGAWELAFSWWRASCMFWKLQRWSRSIWIFFVNFPQISQADPNQALSQGISGRSSTAQVLWAERTLRAFIRWQVTAGPANEALVCEKFGFFSL